MLIFIIKPFFDNRVGAFSEYLDILRLQVFDDDGHSLTGTVELQCVQQLELEDLSIRSFLDFNKAIGIL